MDVVFIIARVLFALVLLASGLAHFKNTEAMTGYATFKKVPMPKQSVMLSGVLLVLCGLSIVLGVYLDLGALVVAVLLLVMSVKMHDFWAADDASKQAEMINFMKNVSMAGAALLMFATLADIPAGAEPFGPMLTDALFGK